MNGALETWITAAAAGPETMRARALGRLMTAATDDPQAVEAMRQAVAERGCRRPHVIGITGPPGAGKSTLVDALIARRLYADPTQRLVVAAVDPSSPFTGGAILGDRVRMMRHAPDPRVFIRSLATRGRLGGLCDGLDGIFMAAALWGADAVLVETVGVGQNEIDIARWADCTCLVLAPGQGDGVQWLKSGLMEIGDVYVVNKADRDGADALLAQLTTAVERWHASPRRGFRKSAAMPHGVPPVVAVSAEQGSGIDALSAILARNTSSSSRESSTHV